MTPNVFAAAMYVRALIPPPQMSMNRNGEFVTNVFSRSRNGVLIVPGLMMLPPTDITTVFDIIMIELG